jgi:ParB family chromosome partitioning protein
MSKQALGKGLGALIPQGPDAGQRGVHEIELSRIIPDGRQPRKTFHDESLAELANSIKASGVIQPIIVRKADGGGYGLIAGERRYRASLMAGLKRIPAIVKDVSPAEALELALVENIQREDLNPIETADAYGRLVKEFDMTQEAVADRVGKERSTVANFLRLLTLPVDIKKDLALGSLSMGHAKAILSVEPAARQLALRREILSRGLSVREAESCARRMKAPGHIVTVKKKEPSPQIVMLEDELKRSLGTKVHIKAKGKGGAIEIEYYSADEFERLLDLLRK